MSTYESQILPRTFYDRNSEEVAQALLGKFLVRKIAGKVLVGQIVETEAYHSVNDEASHSFKGQNKRNKSLYKMAGHAYVHTMRQWYLIDVVTEGENIPSSVLIRAVEPVEGMDILKIHRNTDSLKNLTSGPSKLCQAFKITLDLDGVDLASSQSSLFISNNPTSLPADSIAISGRIGISKATELPLRFWIKNNPFVSR